MSEMRPADSNEQPSSAFTFPAEEVFKEGQPDLDQILGSFEATKQRFGGRSNKLALTYAMDIHLGFALHTWVHAQTKQSQPLASLQDLIDYLYDKTQHQWQNTPEADERGINKYMRLKQTIDGVTHRPAQAAHTDIAALFYSNEEQFVQLGYLEQAPLTFAEIAAWRPES